MHDLIILKDLNAVSAKFGITTRSAPRPTHGAICGRCQMYDPLNLLTLRPARGISGGVFSRLVRRNAPQRLGHRKERPSHPPHSPRTDLRTYPRKEASAQRTKSGFDWPSAGHVAIPIRIFRFMFSPSRANHEVDSNSFCMRSATVAAFAFDA